MESKPKHYWLYVLLLNGGRYYIGKTSQHDPYKRIDQHLNKFYTAQWVKKHGFLDVTEIIDIGYHTGKSSAVAEQELTLKYMKKYGYQKVRGGTLTYSGDYVKVYDYFFTKDNFHQLLSILFMTGVIMYLGFKYVL